jgi:hypothetical protein
VGLPSAVNISFQLFLPRTNALDFDVDIKLTRTLLSSYYSQIDKLRRTSGGRVLFSRITLLYLAKQACIVCGETGAMMDDAQSYEAIGLAYLMANDLMLPFTPSATCPAGSSALQGERGPPFSDTCLTARANAPTRALFRELPGK